MAKAADKRDKAMANTKWSAWWHNSNKWCFYSSSTFSELKTRKKSNHVGFMYLQKKERNKIKKQNYFTSMTAFSNHWFLKGKRKKKILSHCESVSFKDSAAHISTCAPSVCGMCRYHLTVQLDPTPPPHPSHRHTHRPLKQDVQKLVFSIKQCRALT